MAMEWRQVSFVLALSFVVSWVLDLGHFRYPIEISLLPQDHFHLPVRSRRCHLGRLPTTSDHHHDPRNLVGLHPQF